jgi:hypothetical protein
MEIWVFHFKDGCEAETNISLGHDNQKKEFSMPLQSSLTTQKIH